MHEKSSSHPLHLALHILLAPAIGGVVLSVSTFFAPAKPTHVMSYDVLRAKLTQGCSKTEKEFINGRLMTPKEICNYTMKKLMR